VSINQTKIENLRKTLLNKNPKVLNLENGFIALSSYENIDFPEEYRWFMTNYRPGHVHDIYQLPSPFQSMESGPSSNHLTGLMIMAEHDMNSGFDTSILRTRVNAGGHLKVGTFFPGHLSDLNLPKDHVYTEELESVTPFLTSLDSENGSETQVKILVEQTDVYRHHGHPSNFIEYHPRRNGLIPFAWTMWGYISWIPIGPPDSWPIAFTPNHGGYEIFHLSFLEFMTQILQNTLDFKINTDFNGSFQADTGYQFLA
jgi:hypothetical protein